jgi:hypothetical protein
LFHNRYSFNELINNIYLVKHTKRKRGQVLRLRNLRYRQTPCNLKRVMPTPAGVNSYFCS